MSRRRKKLPEELTSLHQINCRPLIHDHFVNLVATKSKDSKPTKRTVRNHSLSNEQKILKSTQRN
jgi:hypothetical protein